MTDAELTDEEWMEIHRAIEWVRARMRTLVVAEIDPTALDELLRRDLAEEPLP